LKEASPHRDSSRVLAFGIVLWLAALAVYWPSTLSFGDEVGYIGQARLVLDGHLRPTAESQGHWVTTSRGLVGKYPYLGPLLMAPLFAVTPRLVFILGPLAAIASVYVAGRALREWGRSPAWALVLLAHPTIALLARTAMTDVILAASTLGAWWALRRGRPALAPLLFGVAVGIKAVGALLVGALLVGEGLRAWREAGTWRAAVNRRLMGAAAGALAGGVFTLAMNFFALGTPWFAYAEAHEDIGVPTFSPRHLLTSAPSHLAGLMLMPPLLVVLGARALWRRREYGPLILSLGFSTLMCVYFFVDRGRSPLENLVMAPRLILAPVAFLLVGYADALAGLFRRWGDRPALAYAGALVPAIMCLTLSARHERWQRPDEIALSRASAIVAQEGAGELGLTENATKAGMLYDGRLVVADPNHAPRVILCSTRSASYRDPTGTFSCEFPGYEVRHEQAGLQVLVRRDHVR
jgi:hypothetical protein